MGKVIATAATTGSIHTPTKSQHPTITPRQLSLEPATLDEARGILGLKGLDKVNW